MLLIIYSITHIVGFLQFLAYLVYFTLKMCFYDEITYNF